MKRHIVTVPPGLLRFTTSDWDIDWRSQSAGTVNDGTTKTVLNAFPRWVGSPGVVLPPEQIGRWQAVRAHAQGPVGVYRVQMVDPVIFEDQQSSQEKPWSNGEPFSTGEGWAHTSTCVAAEAAERGAVEISVSSTMAPKVGQIMSHSLWPFRVTWVEEMAPDTYRLGVQMPLRAAMAAGDVIMLRGEGLFEATDDRMGNPSYGLGRVSRFQLSFREYLNR